MSEPFIDVRIPYEPGSHLGAAYNRAMETVKDWALFLDHDVLVRCNPQWYEICQQAIREVGHTAGFITCVTNRISPLSTNQFMPASPDTDDIKTHLGIAKKLWDRAGLNLREIPLTTKPFSGFFLLTHKKAWLDVGGFIDGFLGVDSDYSLKIERAGYKRYVIGGLYVYHTYRMKERLGL